LLRCHRLKPYLANRRIASGLVFCSKH
jgi:hypothetical protein